MDSMNKPIAGTFGFTDFIVGVVTKDLNQEQATYRLRDGEGSSVAWILGHLMHYRHVVMATLGSPSENAYEAFGEAGASDGKDYPALDDLTRDWKQIGGELQAVLAKVTDEDLTSSAEGAHNEKSLLDAISFYQWHEAYHMGVLGAIRTELGIPATAESVLALQSA